MQAAVPRETGFFSKGSVRRTQSASSTSYGPTKVKNEPTGHRGYPERQLTSSPKMRCLREARSVCLPLCSSCCFTLSISPYCSKCPSIPGSDTWGFPVKEWHGVCSLLCVFDRDTRVENAMRKFYWDEHGRRYSRGGRLGDDLASGEPEIALEIVRCLLASTQELHIP